MKTHLWFVVFFCGFDGRDVFFAGRMGPSPSSTSAIKKRGSATSTTTEIRDGYLDCLSNRMASSFHSKTKDHLKSKVQEVEREAETHFNRSWKKSWKQKSKIVKVSKFSVWSVWSHGRSLNRQVVPPRVHTGQKLSPMLEDLDGKRPMPSADGRSNAYNIETAEAATAAAQQQQLRQTNGQTIRQSNKQTGNQPDSDKRTATATTANKQSQTLIRSDLNIRESSLMPDSEKQI